MYIQTNIPAMNVLRNYQMNMNFFSKSMERLATGYRINRAADDAAGLAISEHMRFQMNGLKQSSRNIQDGISLLQTAEGAMTEVHSMLQRMNVIATQASNGIYSDTDRGMLQKELTQLREEINSIVKEANFNGVKLLNGQYALDPANNKNGLVLQVGDKNEDTITLDLPDVLSSLEDLEDLDISTDEGAQEAIEKIKDMVDNISQDRAKFGAYQNRLEHRYNFVTNTLENISAAHMRIRDTDIAEEIMNFSRAQILTQVSIAMMAQANAAPSLLLRLLG